MRELLTNARNDEVAGVRARVFAFVYMCTVSLTVPFDNSTHRIFRAIATCFLCVTFEQKLHAEHKYNLITSE